MHTRWSQVRRANSKCRLIRILTAFCVHRLWCCCPPALLMSTHRMVYSPLPSRPAQCSFPRPPLTPPTDLMQLDRTTCRGATRHMKVKPRRQDMHLTFTPLRTCTTKPCARIAQDIMQMILDTWRNAGLRTCWSSTRVSHPVPGEWPHRNRPRPPHT